MIDIPDGFLKELDDELAAMSGLILFHVTGTWANKGRKGEIDCIVESRTAAEAIAIAWGPEDDRDLRTINAKWLSPIECVLKRNDLGRRHL